jgi:hypothetical protein
MSIKHLLASLLAAALAACSAEHADAPSAAAAPLRIESPSPSAGAQFGRAVAIEGDLVAIGAPYYGAAQPAEAPGAVFLYRIDDGALTLIGQVTGADAGIDAGQSFGAAIEIHRGHLAIGAPGAMWDAVDADNDRGAVAIFAFDGDFANMTLRSVLGDGLNLSREWFGFDVALDGDLMAVAAVHADQRGGVYLFQSDDDFRTVRLIDEIGPALGLSPNDAFGHTVELERGLMVIGADKDDAADDAISEYGAVYLFSYGAGFSGLNPRGVIRHGAGVQLEEKDFFGATAAMEGNRLFIGAPGDDGPFAQEQTPEVIARRGTGAVYAFDLSATPPALRTMIGNTYAIHLPTSKFDMSGYFIGASGDRLVIGAPYANDGAGAAYLVTYTD